MTIRMRHTRGHSQNRRSHHGLKETGFSKCDSCGAPHKRHIVCENCGMYRGRQVIDIAKKKAKAEERAKKKTQEQSK